jgi:two-component system sensor histidine kinase KdpD
MGLGLSVCRTIIEAHRGNICAMNNAEGGATFHFSLPARSQAQENGT